MKENESLDALFFELSSEDRLNILRELSKINIKMQELAKKLDLTATEASRQLQRMSKSELIERLSDGSYTITQYGKLILFLSSSLEFSLKHKQYFLNHDIWQLPPSFIYRFGELSHGMLLTEMGEVMLRWEELIKGAEDHLWIMTPQRIPSLIHVIEERHLQGVILRYIITDQLSTSQKEMFSGQTVERRFFNIFNFGILKTEKEAMIAFPFMDGTPNPSGFFGSDASFLKWVNDLFIHYWGYARI